MRPWIVEFISLYANLWKLTWEVFHKFHIINLRIYFRLTFQHKNKFILLNTENFCNILSEVTNWLVIGETYRLNLRVVLVKPTLYLNHDRFKARHSSSQIIFDYKFFDTFVSVQKDWEKTHNSILINIGHTSIHKLLNELRIGLLQFQIWIYK